MFHIVVPPRCNIANKYVDTNVILIIILLYLNVPIISVLY